MMRRCAVMGLAAIGLCASMLLARSGVVRTKDGRRFEGDVVESVNRPDDVEITVRGGTITLKRDEVASIEYTGGIDQQYKQRLAKLGANATAGDHLGLARWLFDQHAYEDAVLEAQMAQQLDPNNADAQILITTIRRQKKLETRVVPAATGPAPTTGPITGGGKPVSRKFLTPDQIQVIKRSELRSDDGQIRVIFANDVLKKFNDKIGAIATNNGPARITDLNDFMKTLTILQRGTVEMQQDVKIVNDPGAMADFKRIQPTIIAGCTAAGCHNETSKTNFILFGGGNGDDITYTNFFILNQYMKGTQKMIDRVRPQASLVLNYGLPRERTTSPHKEVFGMKGPFASDQAVGYLQLLAWISNSLTTVEPTYAIEYAPPTGVAPAASQPVAPTTAPTTAPTSAPASQPMAPAAP